MRQQKKPDKKERNYSVWLTGIVLVMVYVILLDSMPGPKEGACRSLFREQLQQASEETLALMHETKAEQED
ncbi:hypothetical protein D5278_05385 [bacterium 1XD21-13]|nr:hypothetical protein [bacterium 1XD21-13]